MMNFLALKTSYEARKHFRCNLYNWVDTECGEERLNQVSVFKYSHFLQPLHRPAFFFHTTLFYKNRANSKIPIIAMSGD